MIFQKKKISYYKGTLRVVLILLFDCILLGKITKECLLSIGANFIDDKHHAKQVLSQEIYFKYFYFFYPIFTPTTIIAFSLPQANNVTLKVFDALGREVATLVNGFRSEGEYNVKFDASSLSSGIYFYRLHAGSYVETKKLVLMK